MATQNNQGDSPLKAAAAELNKRVDCADLAKRLGFKQPGNKGSFVSPKEPDHSAALACYPAGNGKGSRWKDHRNEGVSGGPIDLLMLHGGQDFPTAVKELAQMYGVTIAAQAR